MMEIIMRNYLKIKNWQKYLLICLLILIISISSLFFFINFNKNTEIYQDKNIENHILNTKVNPKISGDYDYILNLTNEDEIDGNRYYHGTNITIKGLVYYPFPYRTDPDVNVSVVVDGILYPQFSNKTNDNGVFWINYTVNYSLNIYTNHGIEVWVIDNLNIYYNHYYTISVNATSYFDIDNYNLNNPQLAGGYYKVPGFLRYDNSSGINNHSWYCSIPHVG